MERLDLGAPQTQQAVELAATSTKNITPGEKRLAEFESKTQPRETPNKR
jgi:hypothetical protein